MCGACAGAGASRPPRYAVRPRTPAYRRRTGGRREAGHLGIPVLGGWSLNQVGIPHTRRWVSCKETWACKIYDRAPPGPWVAPGRNMGAIWPRSPNRPQIAHSPSSMGRPHSSSTTGALDFVVLIVFCLTGTVPNVACGGTVGYSDTDSDESDIGFKLEYKKRGGARWRSLMQRQNNSCIL